MGASPTDPERSRHRPLSTVEIERVLESNRIVRVGFFEGADRYVVPLGFVWHGAAFWGTTTPGRKTSIAERCDRVAFVVDDGEPFSTPSVMGEGRFEIVSLEAARPVLPELARRFADAPPEGRARRQAELLTGARLCWRIAPIELAGRVYLPDEGGSRFGSEGPT